MCKTKHLNQICRPKYAPFYRNICACYSNKIFDYPELEKPIIFEIWDTACQEKNRPLAKIVYNRADAILFVYNKIRFRTFEEIKNY